MYNRRRIKWLRIKFGKDTNNQNFRKFLYAEALGTLSSHLTFGTRGFLVTIQDFLPSEVLQALTQFHRAASSWYRQTQVPERIQSNRYVIAGGAV